MVQKLLAEFSRNWYEQLRLAGVEFVTHVDGASVNTSDGNDNDKNKNSDKTKDNNEKNSEEESKAKKPSVFKGILRSFGRPFFIAGGMKLIYDMTKYLGPVFLSIFLTYAENFDNSQHAQNQGMDNICATIYEYPCANFFCVFCFVLLFCCFFNGNNNSLFDSIFNVCIVHCCHIHFTSIFSSLFDNWYAYSCSINDSML